MAELDVISKARQGGDHMRMGLPHVQDMRHAYMLHSMKHRHITSY